MRTINIGRSHSNDCVLDNPTVSRNHAILVVDSDGLNATLRDLNSSQGTFVNGSKQKITSDVRVAMTDIVRFGSEAMQISAIIEKANKTVIKPAPTTLGVEHRTIGKAGDNQIVINHDDVSRKHALLYKENDGTVVIEDLNSTNGTFVNGSRITSKRLVPGDKVTITRNHVLNWEEIFPSTAPVRKIMIGKTLKIASVFIAILLLGVGIWAYLTKFGEWSKEKIYKEYHSAVCWVYVQYGYKVFIDGEDVTNTLCQLLNMPLNDVIHIEEDNIVSGGAGAQGTAFFISSDGKIVTNLHISRPWLFSDDASKIDHTINQLIAYLSIQNPLLTRSKIEVKGIVQGMLVIPDGLPICEANAIECEEYKGHDDINKDVAILKLKTNKLPQEVTRFIDIDVADCSDDAIVEGRTIYTIGFPYGALIALDSNKDLRNQVHDGSITQSRGDYEFGHDAETAGGASGSPIFNAKGKLIGVHHAGMTGVTGAQGFNSAIKIKYVLELLNN